MLRVSSIRTGVGVTLGVAALLAGRDGAAQPAAAVAEQLYLDGQQLMAQHKIDEACAKFADSEQLDRALGTLINLAVCHEQQGKLATAWGEFVDSAAQAAKGGQRDRESFARAHAAALESKLQRLVVEVGIPLSGLEVTLDGQVLPPSTLGTAIPLDPGVHELHARATGKKTWRMARLTIGPGVAVTRVPITFEDDEAPSAADVPVVKAAQAPDPGALDRVPQAADAPSTVDDPGRRVAGLVVGGAGVAGIGAGAVLVALAHSLQSSSTDEIHRGDVTNGHADYTSALHDQTAGWITGAVGLTALAAGVYLVLTSSHSSGPPARATGARDLVVGLPTGRGDAGFVIGMGF